MRKQSERNGVSFTTTKLHGVRQMFLSASVWDSGGDATAQIRSILKDVNTVLSEEGFASGVVWQNVFLKDIGQKQLLRLIMREFCGKYLPATNYIPQPPADGSDLSVELIAYTGPEVMINLSTFGDATFVQFHGLEWFWGGGFTPNEKPIGSYSRSLSAFKKMEERLNSAGFEIEEIMRTWLYQGSLVLEEGDSQRYKELNRARTDFFRDRKFLKKYLPERYENAAVYPASTGIGADGQDVVMSCFALKTNRDDVVVVPLENPNQTSSFDYSEMYSPQSPKFARAMAFLANDMCQVFISGTASITDSESRFPNETIKQTEQTLDNIEQLISGENLAKHGIEGYEAGINDLVSARIYVKYPEDYEKVKTLCDERLSGIPKLYLVADICRPELNVEIEGIAVARKSERDA